MARAKIPRKDLEYELSERFGRKFSFPPLGCWYPTIRMAYHAYLKYLITKIEEADEEENDDDPNCKDLRQRIFNTRRDAADACGNDPEIVRTFPGFERINIPGAIDYTHYD